MTDNEIIKALECCIKDDAKYCDDCSYYDEKEEHKQLCVYRLHRDTLDLIARLKDRNKRYQLKNTNQRHTLAMLNKQVAEQKAEIERLNLENLQMVASIKRLKSEAIKEFWDKAKQRREFRTCPYVYISDGDNLVKEMTGGVE